MSGRRRCPVRTGLVLLVFVVTGCQEAGSTPEAGADAPEPSATSSISSSPGSAARAAPKSVPRTAATGAAARLLRLDGLAGVRSSKVAWSGSGRFVVVPGDVPAPIPGRRVYRVRVEVESGVDVDRTAFAAYVLATLNDRRSWTRHGARAFARTDGAADIRVVLASPATSAGICRPLRTFGKLSCRAGNRAVLTSYRWVTAIPEYSGNHDGYRHYVINHEVGHALGHSHQYCAGRGKVAPVMMQQTKGLKGCRPNPWPFP